MLGWFIHTSLMVGNVQASTLFSATLGVPDLYWPWPTLGAWIGGLAFYAVRLARIPN
jgi:hypothetical protein